jgi:hypothetical protein
MDEIKTKIDHVFEFIQRKGKTTPKEVSREIKLNSDELDKYLEVLRKSGLIKVHYKLFNTYLSAADDDPVKLADQFKSQLYEDYTDNTAAVDKNLKIMALKSMLME